MFTRLPPIWPRKGKDSRAKEEERRVHNKLRKRALTPSLPSRLGELESIAVTHGAEEDHCQRHQSQLHSPCCLPGHAGSPPATRWIRWGGPLPLWGRWIPLLLGQMSPPLSCGAAVFRKSVSPFPPLCLSGSFTLLAAASASLCRGGRRCGCESKQAWGATSHRAEGSTGKGSRQRGVVGRTEVGVEGLHRGWRGGRGEEIVELLLVQPMKLGVGCQGSREPAVGRWFPLTSMCLGLRKHSMQACRLKHDGCRFLTVCDNGSSNTRTCWIKKV